WMIPRKMPSYIERGEMPDDRTACDVSQLSFCQVRPYSRNDDRSEFITTWCYARIKEILIHRRRTLACRIWSYGDSKRSRAYEQHDHHSSDNGGSCGAPPKDRAEHEDQR